MPELPEVETIRRQLEKLISGKTISSIEVLNPGSFRAEKDSLIGKSITRVGRKGKVLTLSLQNDLQLFVHLKMSGRLLILPQQYARHSRPRPLRSGRVVVSRLAAKHLRVRINFQDGDSLEFHDQRKFGWITDDPAVLPRGVDALDPALSLQPKAGRPLAENKLAEILASSNRPVKTILLDQSKIAGIGNIYASEILWHAKINPATKGPTFCAKSGALLAAIRKVLTEAIESGGSTMDDQLYRHVSGQTGNYWSRRRVYDRAGEPCRRSACRKAGALIQKTVIGQRSTYFCPNCQRL